MNSDLASHTLYDGKVGHVVASLFDHGTVSVAFPGTHRCFSTTASACSGTTTACGNGSEKFRITDVAHVMDYLINKKYTPKPLRIMYFCSANNLVKITIRIFKYSMKWFLSNADLKKQN